MPWRSLLLAFGLVSTLLAGDTIRVSVNEWTTLNPLLIMQNSDAEAVDLVFDRLVTLNARGEFIPELLESWTVLQGGREVVLKLRPGLVWQDGHPIEAEDVVFTWKALRLPQVRRVADTVAGVASLDSLTAEGPLTVRIRLKRPRGTLLSDLYNLIPVPRHLYEVGARPAEAPINFHPVGSGPYRVVGRATTKWVQLERWDGYRGIHPGLAPAFELWDASNEQDVLPDFRAERLHYSVVSALRYYLVRKGAQGRGLVQAMVVPQASLRAYFLNCDSKHSLLGDRTLRQALYELLPWQSLARAERFFPRRLATSFWPPESWAHDPEPRPLPQVERAAAILEAAGWRLGPDGVRQDGRGRRLVLVAYEAPAPIKPSNGVLLAAQAARVGIRIEVRTLPLKAVAEKASNHEGDLWAIGWALALDPDVDSPLFTLEGYRTKANLSGYLNPEMDRLFEEGRHTLDMGARQQIYRRISRIIDRDVPVIPISYMQTRVLVHRRLRGVAFSPLGQSFGFWPGRRGWTLWTNWP
ncbi:MAG: ABC transporter substrate-binding protein [Geothrix sp.]|nr:ABC transporter substrate-binding protein [Geothrix sp.]